MDRDCCKNSVLEQSYAGNPISTGSKLPWGSRIDLVIGSGLNQEAIAVPSVLGLTFTEAKVVLELNGITLGAVIPDADVVDTATSFVYKQSPPRKNDNDETVFIQPGQLMDIWLSATLKVPVDSLKNN